MTAAAIALVLAPQINGVASSGTTFDSTTTAASAGGGRPSSEIVASLDGDSCTGADGRHAALDTACTTRIIGAAPDARVRIGWAIQRFAEAGLTLPNLVVRSHPSDTPCRGNEGIYRRGERLDIIELCSEATAVVLHELAHAWESHFATDDARQAFLAAVGLDHWAGDDVPYAERGVEASAQAIAWALAERPLSSFDLTVFGDELDAYTTLTGRESPRLSGDA
jgi:hypothetical protein